MRLTSGLRTCLLLTVLAHAATSSAQPDLSGVWMLNGPSLERELLLTELGQQIQNDYDLLVDDPSLYCVPASTSRVWANPNVRIVFEQLPDQVLINYEFYDLRRVIPLGDESVLQDQPSTANIQGTFFKEMGSSFAHYEGDRLIIESRNHAPGYIRTSRGVPQGENTVTLEELWIEDGELRIVHTYIDDTLYEVPFVLDYRFARIEEGELPLYECTDADYDWFYELNNSEEEASQ
ncbi:MAG: hypothetical protein RL839_09410 [Gammaproteobacteria bacterium]